MTKTTVSNQNNKNKKEWQGYENIIGESKFI